MKAVATRPSASPAGLPARAASQPPPPVGQRGAAVGTSATTGAAAPATGAVNKAKDPPILVAERFRAAMMHDAAEGAMYSTLDLSACLSTPMAIVYSRGRIRKWIAFDRRVIRGCGAVIEFEPDEKGGIVVDAESGRSVVSTYRIGALQFTDYFTLNNVLMVRSVRRVIRKLRPRSAAERKLTDDLLLAWTGPHFTAFCSMSTATAGSHIDNRVVALPVLDFSFCQLEHPRDMLVKPPRDGKEIRDKNVYLHYLVYSAPPAAATAGAASPGNPASASSGAGGDGGARSQRRPGAGPSRDDVIIKAKNRVGDEDHLVIDRNELARGSKGSDQIDQRIELLEDAEAVIKDDKCRFAASGLKLNNNALAGDVAEIEQVTRLVVMNAFYFLAWVDLSSNAITRVPDLSAFPIVSLYLHDNRIASLADVGSLRDMTTLQNLTLFGNPLQSDLPAHYKLPVLSLLLVPDEAAERAQAQQRRERRQHAGDLQRALERARASTPGAKARTGTHAAAVSPAAAQARDDNAGGSGGGDDEDEGATAAKPAGVVSPVRQRFFPDVAPLPPPPPPPPILKLRTFDYGLVTPDDRRALSAYLAMFVKKPPPASKARPRAR
jgi:hypothetical protein